LLGNIGTNSAQAADLSATTKSIYTKNLKKSKSVVRFFESKKHNWRLHKRFDACSDVRERYSQRRGRLCFIARTAYRIHNQRISRLKALLTPPTPVFNRYSVDSCLRALIDRENPPWETTLDYGFGHGNVYEAYGLPMANPGTKMASAGPDWRTNPWTQIRWMIGYVNGRYGGSCAALAHWERMEATTGIGSY
jgi:hypothetical protein